MSSDLVRSGWVPCWKHDCPPLEPTTVGAVMVSSRRICIGYIFYGPEDRCAYCGAPAESIDHTIPQSFSQSNWKAGIYFEMIAVSSCLDCNGRASDKLDATFRERQKRIMDSLRRDAGRLLASPEWEEDEINNLGPGLRAQIRLIDKKAREVRKRIANMMNPAWPEPAVPAFLWKKGSR